jgi:drug/metabolite transporter (DMT)-like permease
MIEAALQGAGVAAGVVGAVFVSGESRHSRRIGFGVWIVGNACWVVAGILLSNPFLVAMFGFYFLTALLGAANNDRSEGSL